MNATLETLPQAALQVQPACNVGLAARQFTFLDDIVVEHALQAAESRHRIELSNVIEQAHTWGLRRAA